MQDLPVDLLEVITNHTPCLCDILRFSGTCSSLLQKIQILFSKTQYWENRAKSLEGTDFVVFMGGDSFIYSFTYVNDCDKMMYVAALASGNDDVIDLFITRVLALDGELWATTMLKAMGFARRYRKDSALNRLINRTSSNYELFDTCLDMVRRGAQAPRW